MKRIYSVFFGLLALLLLFAGCSFGPDKYTADDFDKINVPLEKPTVSDIERTYKKLPKRGMVTVTCPYTNLAGVLSRMENAGFIGLTVDLKNENSLIMAYKGKDGDCYETGRSATPKLNFAVAAVDDADHLLFKSTRICEKTALIYSTTLYKNYLTVTEPDPALVAKNEKAPFLCATAEDKALELSKAVTGKAEKAETGIYYKGPFKMLITKDGTVIRRGKALMVGKATAEGLLKDNCVRITIKMNKRTAGKYNTVNYQEKYRVMRKDFIVAPMQIGNFEGTFEGLAPAKKETKKDVMKLGEPQKKDASKPAEPAKKEPVKTK